MKRRGAFDYILLETSGLADPGAWAACSVPPLLPRGGGADISLQAVAAPVSPDRQGVLAGRGHAEQPIPRRGGRSRGRQERSQGTRTCSLSAGEQPKPLNARTWAAVFGGRRSVAAAPGRPGHGRDGHAARRERVCAAGGARGPPDPEQGRHRGHGPTGARDAPAARYQQRRAAAHHHAIQVRVDG